MANTGKRSIAIPEAGADAEILFSMQDLIGLQKDIAAGDQAARIGWLPIVIAGLNACAPDVIGCCIKHGVKRTDPKFAPWGIPLSELAVRLADGVLLQVHGRTSEELGAERQQEA